MTTRPVLDRTLSSKAFRDFYYLKDELTDFCRKYGLPISGTKMELTERIAHFLDTGSVLSAPTARKKASSIHAITEDAIIEPDFVCSQVHREFFRAHIGKGFSFNVTFQNWLKQNTGKTYHDAIAAYEEILAQKKMGKMTIDKQFEYNTYIRDFFADNHGRTLKEAIRCWTYKKQLQGHNRYERSDLVALE